MTRFTDKQLLDELKYYKLVSPVSLAGVFRPDVSNTYNNDLLDQFYKIILDVSDKGIYSTSDIVRKLKELSTSDSNLFNLYEIYSTNSDHINEISSTKAKYVIDEKKSETKGDLEVTWREFAKLKSSAKNAKSNVVKAGNSHITFFLSKTPMVSLSMRSADLLNLFCNAIPTIEWSRCVPFLEVKVQTAKALYTIPNTRDDRIVIAEPSLLKSLERDVLPGTADEKMYKAATGKASGPNSKIEESVSTADMGMFLQPQTLTNPKRGYLDPFRPTISIDSFNISIVPSTDMRVYQAGDLSLTIHDRSRLGEFAPLLKSSAYGGTTGSTKFLITWGWSHPDKNSPYGALINRMRMTEKYAIKNSSMAFDESGQVKVTLELYTYGQQAANILRISGDVDSSANWYDELEQLKEIVKSTRAKLGKAVKAELVELRMPQILDAAEKGTIEGLKLSAPEIKAITLNIINKLNAVRNEDISEDAKSLAAALDKLFLKFDDEKAQTGYIDYVAQQKKLISERISSKIDALRKTKDPFANTTGNFAQYYNANKKSKNGEILREYVSIGKIILLFFATGINSLSDITETQLIFYTFNDFAAAAFNSNIAEFPIEIGFFQKMFNAFVKERGNPDLTLNEFMSWLSDTFLNDPSSPGYGLSNLYSKRTDADSKNNTAKVKDKFTKNTKGAEAFSEERDKLLNGYYNSSSKTKDPEFKLPILQVFIECSQLRTDGPGELKSDGERQTITRIHIFDKQSTPWTFVNAINKAHQFPTSDNEARPTIATAAGLTQEFNRRLNPITHAAGVDGDLFELVGEDFRLRTSFPELKKMIKMFVPSVTFGSQASGITKATFSTMNDQLHSTVLMQKQTYSRTVDPAGMNGGLPMTILPAMLDATSFGCPMLTVNTQLYFDFGTNTTADNFYFIKEASHTISAGRFETQIKFVPFDAYASYSNVRDRIGKIVSALKK